MNEEVETHQDSLVIGYYIHTSKSLELLAVDAQNNNYLIWDCEW